VNTLMRLRDDLVRSQNAVEDMLDEIHRPAETPALSPGTPRRRPARRRLRMLEDAWDAPGLHARRSVEKVVVAVPAQGRATAEIDGVVFTLPRGVGVLLDLLSAPDASDGDGGAEWKTVPEILDRLHQRLGRKLGVHALDELVRRLRAQLVAAGFSRHVLQVDAERGKRIAMKFPNGREAHDGTSLDR
jgi:hypothetical protein